MLQILINQTQADIAPDISITLSFANPFFEDDKIPTPHIYSFEIPTTSANLAIFGQVQRIASADVQIKYFAEVLFDGISIAAGNLSITQINDISIDVEIECATFLDKFKKKLHQCDLGRASFGFATPRPDGGSLMTRANAALFDQFWIDQLYKRAPDYVAVPLAIKGEKWSVIEDDRLINPEGGNINICNMRINQYNQTGYNANPIIPAFRVAYLLEKLDSNLPSTFMSSELDRLMLVCNYHPNYHPNRPTRFRDSRVWTADAKTGEVYVEFADYMPDIEAGLFVNEMLKLVSASLYTVNGGPVIALNKDVINSNDTIDWSGKVIDSYSILFEKKGRYRLTYDREDDEELSPENETEHYTGLSNMLFNRRDSNANLCGLQETGQVFDSYVNSALSTETNSHYTYELIKDSVANSEYLEQDEQNDIETHEVTIQASPVRTVLVEEVPRDRMRNPSFSGWASRHPYNYIPEVEKAEKTRPTTVYIGHYAGRAPALMTYGYQYPQITAIGVAPSVPLVNDGIYNAYHQEFANWMSKTRQVIKGQIQLQPADIHSLDMRKKIGFDGRTFLIKSLDIPIGENSIGLADFELVEV